MPQRLPHIDVAKGLMIILVMAYHLVWLPTVRYGVENVHWDAILNACKWSYCWFFMPFFFIVNGYCSHFNKTLQQHLTKDVMSLILPMMLLMFGKYQWFVMAFFFARLLYWAISQVIIKSWVRLICLMAISIVATLILYSYPRANVLFLLDGLALAMFIEIGAMLRKMPSFSVFIAIIIIIVAGAACYHYNQFIPMFHGFTPLSISMWPIALICSVAGSIIFIAIGKVLRKCKFLNWFGKNSMIVFIMHLCLMGFFLHNDVVTKYLTSISANLWLSYGIYFVMLIGFIGLCAISIVVLNSKYFKWILGKFN